MTDAATVVFAITVVASLFLAVRAVQSHGLSFENKAWMAVAWAVIIAALSFVIGHLAP